MLVPCSPAPVSRTSMVYRPMDKHPLWCILITWCDGQTPWEGAQVAALEVLLEICQDYGDELVNGPAGSIPRVSVTDVDTS